jgi:peptide methionine sulfoxide reductase msrA/msrB
MRRPTLAILAIPILAIVPLALAMLAPGSGAPNPMTHQITPTSQTTDTVTVRVFNAQGELTDPIALPRVVLTDAEWKARLAPEQYRILRHAGTEAPFCGTLLDNKKTGVYTCAGCSLPLFTSDHKFDSGTGWPSFYQPIAKENVVERRDVSYGMVRTEIVCARCEGHLGHVFNDGPKPTGERHCLNSESLNFTETEQLAELAEVADAVFAGGCFWCVEAVFEELRGVYEVISGYAGGDGSPTYKAVVTGTTGHAEAVRVVFDPKQISLEDLYKVHFATHDPTTLNRQGGDVGTQYRSTIFYRDDKEKAIAQAFIADLTEQKTFRNPIVTTLEPLSKFHVAEEYHQDYVCNNPGNGYVRAVALPKVEKVREKFADKLKETPQP